MQTAPGLPRAWASWRDEFPIFQRKTYYNTCSLGALSRRAAHAVNSFLELWDASGRGRDLSVDNLRARCGEQRARLPIPSEGRHQRSRVPDDRLPVVNQG